MTAGFSPVGFLNRRSPGQRRDPKKKKKEVGGLS